MLTELATAKKETAFEEARTAWRASLLVVGYNESKIILDCIGSLREQDMARDEYEIIFVDNGSTDGSADLVESHFPDVKVVRLMPNIGYPAGNNAGLPYCHGQRIVMVSADTTMPKTWLRELLKPMDEDPEIKVCHGAMVIPGDPGYDEGLAKRAVPTEASYVDMTRFGYIRYRRVPTDSEPVPTLQVGGPSAALDRSILDEIGGYLLDGDYYLDCDEIDLGFRVNGRGYKVVAVPRAAYYHRHPFNVQVQPGTAQRKLRRLFRLQRNKFITFYKNMHTLEFLAMLPLALVGAPLKLTVWSERFNLRQRLMNGAGLALFAWAALPVAVVGFFPRFTDKRRFQLAQRRQPRFWFLRELWKRW